MDIPHLKDPNGDTNRLFVGGRGGSADVDNVLENANLNFDASFVNGRIEQIRKKMNQNVK